MICMFDEDFFNSLLQLPGENPWLTHLTNQNYRTRLSKQSNYLLGFVSPNKYSLKINKKWPENQSDLEENEYRSVTHVYCRETNAMVPLMKVNLQIPPRMQGYWSDDNAKMLKIVVESSRGMDDEPSLNVEGSPQYQKLHS